MKRRFEHAPDSNDKPVRHGDCVIIRVDQRTPSCKTRLSADAVRANSFVLLEPLQR